MENKEHFFSFSPKAAALSGKIAYYYIHCSADSDNDISYQYFPHFRNALTIYLDADIALRGMNSVVKEGQPGAYSCIYSRNYTESVSVKISGKFWKLGIAFEPLGYNHFIPVPLAEWIPNGQNDVSDIETELREVAQACHLARMDECVNLLDSYFLKRLAIPENHEVMTRIVSSMMKVDVEQNVQDLAEYLNLDRRTLLRLVQKHLCSSAKTYQQLIKFRLALNEYIEASAKTSFTQLALNHRYYDQPAFIRHFKKITGKTPRAFFQHIHQFGSFDTYWTK